MAMMKTNVNRPREETLVPQHRGVNEKEDERMVRKNYFSSIGSNVGTIMKQCDQIIIRKLK